MPRSSRARSLHRPLVNWSLGPFPAWHLPPPTKKITWNYLGREEALCFVSLQPVHKTWELRRVVSLAHPGPIVRGGPFSHSPGVEAEKPCQVLVGAGAGTGRQCRLLPLNSWSRAHLWLGGWSHRSRPQVTSLSWFLVSSVAPGVMWGPGVTPPLQSLHFGGKNEKEVSVPRSPILLYYFDLISYHKSLL